MTQSTSREALSISRILASDLGGAVGERIDANRESWALAARKANPGMLSMFAYRERLPRRALMPWSGEFVGKHLTALAMDWSLSHDPRVEAEISTIIGELERVQDRGGYLGPFPRDARIVGRVTRITPDVISESAVWDLWGHYHCMVGLLRWHALTGNASSLRICERIVAYLDDVFATKGFSVARIGATEMNMAIAHSLLLLHGRTGNEAALRLARRVESEWEAPGEGDFVRLGAGGTEFHRMPKPRWEALHDVQAIAEMYFLTGGQTYRAAFENIWRSIARGDRHNTGGFSSGEQAVGDPYATGAIETCCTVAWGALSVDMLRMTGDSKVADELELTLFNAALGGQHPSGRWWTYNTPMDGVRRASAHDIVFQSYQGTPELNCCSVNGPRSLLTMGEWGLMECSGDLVLSYYGESTMTVRHGKGGRVSVAQVTDYPGSGLVRIAVRPETPAEFALLVRIPSWSARTMLRVDGEVSAPAPGTYHRISRRWTGSETIKLELDMSAHFWPGSGGKAGFLSIYKGPVLLAYDQRFNEVDPDDLPTVRLPVEWEVQAADDSWPGPLLLMRAAFANGSTLRLCDFATAGATGTWYNSWLPWQPSSLENPGLEWQQWIAR